MRGSVRTLVLAVAIGAVSRCHRTAGTTIAWQVSFGPVIGNELIVGRIMSGRTVWIASGAHALVRVDLDGRRYTRVPLHPLAGDEDIWGLAATAEGGMWTLIGRNTLGQISEDGAIARRIALDEPHVGVFGTGRELLYQVMNFQPPADALTAGPPGSAPRRPWGHMPTRALPFARGAVAALNLVSCGASSGAAIPCWFPDQAAISLIDAAGVRRALDLEGLPIVAPEILLASDNPRRPIRDAIVSASNDVWVLGSGEPPAGDASTRPGGWLLARYDADGRLFRRVRLPEPARLLLAVTDDRCLLLAWDGRVVEVRP